MKTRLLFNIISAVLIFSSTGVSATTYNWTGLGGNTNWNNANNWAPVAVPTSSDAVQIGVNAYAGVNPTINTTGLTCASLTFGNSNTVILTISNAFNVVGAITVHGNCTITGASLVTASSVSATAFTFNVNAPLTLSGSFSTNGTTVTSNATGVINTVGLNLTSATVTLNGVFKSTATVQVPGAGTTSTFTTNAIGNTLSAIYDHTGSDLTWNGSGTSTCAQGDVSSGQTLTIGAGNTVTFTGSLELHGSSPLVGLLINNGTIITNSSIFSDNISSAVTAMTIGSTGIVTLNGSSAQISVGAYTSINNSGTINANSSTNINTGSNSVVTNSSGGQIKLTSAMLNISNSASLNNTGTITAITTSAINTSNPSTITNNSGGAINLTGSAISCTGGSSLSNSGTILASASSSITTGNPVTFTNTSTGVITFNASTATFNGGTTISNSGALNANATSTINTGNPVPVTNISTGSINLSASTLNLTGGAHIDNSGAVTEATGSTITFANPSYINNLTSSSSLTCSASTLNVGAGGSITNSGTVTTGSTSTVLLNGNPAPITNNVNSVFNATSTAFTMVAGSSITNTGGTFTMTSCTLNCSGNPATITNQNSGGTTGVFTIGATAFTFTGTNIINNYGTFTAYNGSSINMTTASTSSSINNYGVFYAGTTANSSCIITLNGSQPKINNATSTANGYFVLGSTSIIYPTSSNTTVTNNASCTFVLQSDAYGSAAIGAVPVGANPSPSLIGTYNVERYYQGSPTYDNVKKRWLERGYRIISSPVNTGTKVNSNNVYGLNYIVGTTVGQTTGATSATNAFVTGATGGSTSAGNPTLYLYRENKAISNATFTSGNFIGITNITSPSSMTTTDGTGYAIPVGNGVLFFFRGAATNYATRTVSPFIAPENVTLTATGLLNQGSFVVKDWYTPTSSNLGYTTASGNSTTNRGFNMVGNPYACTIDWETVNSGGIIVTNIKPTIYAFNPRTNQYDNYSSSSHLGNTATFTGKIVSGQGFFVRASAANPSLTFNETAKAPTSLPLSTSLYMGTPLAQATPQLLRLRLLIDTLNFDDITFNFNAAASTKFNEMEDSEFLPGIGAPESLSSLSADSVQLSVNSLPLPKQAQQVTRLNVNGTKTGLYTFQRTQLDAIPQIYEIWLMDKYKKDSLDLRANITYNFNINLADTGSFGANRFTIVIRQNMALALRLLNFAAIKATAGAQVNWTTENEQNYTNFTVERSTDNGTTFNVVGSLTSSGLGTYSFTDTNPANGTDLYRLKIEDINGTITYSKVVSLTYGNGNATASNISVYPNPTNGVINLSINKVKVISVNPDQPALKQASLVPTFAATYINTAEPSYEIKIMSINGTIIKSVTSSSPTWQDNLSSLAPGTYIINVINNSDKSLVGTSTFVKI